MCRTSNVICLRVHTTEKKKTEKETGTYGHIRPSSFGMLLLFYCRHLWPSPVGLGFSTRFAQAADSLSGERILTHPLGLNALRCGRLVCPRDAARELVVRYRRCWRDCCRCQNPPLPCTSSFSRHSSLLSRGTLGCYWCPQSQLALLHFVLYPEVLDLNLPRLPKALAMRYANGH